MTMQASQPTTRATATFVAEMPSVASARQLAAAAIARWAIPELAEDVCLVVSELATNAVLHGRTDFDVALVRLPSGVRVEVADGSPDPVLPPMFPAVSDPVTLLDGAGEGNELDSVFMTGLTGRGLALVAAVSRRWGVWPMDGLGKTVWAEVGDAPAVGHTPPESGSDAQPVGAPVGEKGPAVVEMIAVPVRLALAAERSLSDLLRELQILTIPGGPDASDPHLVRLRFLLEQRWAWRLEIQSEARRAAACGDRLFDVTFPAEDGLLQWMADVQSTVDGLAAVPSAKWMVSVVPAPEVRAFRAWWRTEVEAQLEGGAARPCPLPAVIWPSAPEGAWADPDLLVSDADRAHDRAGDVARLRQALAGAGSAAAVGRTVADYTMAAFGAVSVALYRGGPPPSPVELAYASEEPDVGPPGLLTGSARHPVCEAVRTGHTVWVRTPGEATYRYPNHDLLGDGTVRALACVPLVGIGAGSSGRRRGAERGKAAIGALWLSFARTRDFLPEDVTFLEEIGRAVSAALIELDRPR